MVIYRILADTIVIIHAAFVAFVGLGLVAIVIGLLFKRSWARNFWFRMLHLSAIAFVVFEEAANMRCPLTVWENHLRQQAGQVGYPGDFLGYWAHNLIFFDLPSRFFTLFYGCVGLTILGIFVLGPPRRPWPKASPADSSANSA